MTLTTTLADIRAAHPCHVGWVKLNKALGPDWGDKPVSFRQILASNGLDDALWCLRVLPPEMEGQIRLLACDFAETALKYVPAGEDRPRLAIETARRFVAGSATCEELAAAGDAAAGDAAGAAARAAARAAAWDAAWDAARAAARAAAWDAAWAAAWDAARDEQCQIFARWLDQFETSEDGQ